MKFKFHFILLKLIIKNQDLKKIENIVSNIRNCYYLYKQFLQKSEIYTKIIH